MSSESGIVIGPSASLSRSFCGARRLVLVSTSWRSSHFDVFEKQSSALGSDWLPSTSRCGIDFDVFASVRFSPMSFE